MNEIERAMEHVHKGIVSLIHLSKAYENFSAEAEELSGMIHDLNAVIDRLDYINEIEKKNKEEMK